MLRRAGAVVQGTVRDASGAEDGAVSALLTADEAAQLAANLACNRGYAVFPCRADKTPATPRGFKDAVRQPDAIFGLWRSCPGPLIGIATGEVSGVSVLDI